MATMFFFALLVLLVILLITAGTKRSSPQPEEKPGVTIPTPDGSGNRMNIEALICSCEDWQHNRSRFIPGAPMRLCKHFTVHFTRHNNALPPSLHTYAPIIYRLARYNEGMPCGRGTEYGHLEEMPYVLYIDAIKAQAHLLLGGRSYELSLSNRAWKPEKPPQAPHFTVRARQLANVGKAF